MKTRFRSFINENFTDKLINQNTYIKAQALLINTRLLSSKKLESLGVYIEEINGKRHQTVHYRSADFTTPLLLNQQTPLQHYILKNYKHIRSDRFHYITTHIKSFVPNNNMDKVIDIIFQQIALTAEYWSQEDIVRTSRFTNFTQMNEIERLNLARQISNKNRALAALGGSVNLLGLIGLFLDSIWLLLVSLKSIYQIAAIHNQPLVGKDGFQKAYTTLASCDLDKIKDKQAILSSLAVASRLLINTENKGLQNALVVEMKAQENISELVTHIDTLLTKANIDLDKYNFKWLGNSLTFLATATGIHYNSLFIEEVIGVANATFAPDIKMVEVAGNTY